MGVAWRCPSCRMILRKVYPFLQDAAKFGLVRGAVTCDICGAKYSSQDVYSGKFDVPEQSEANSCEEHLDGQIANFLLSPPSKEPRTKPLVAK